MVGRTREPKRARDNRYCIKAYLSFGFIAGATCVVPCWLLPDLYDSSEGSPVLPIKSSLLGVCVNLSFAGRAFAATPTFSLGAFGVERCFLQWGHRGLLWDDGSSLAREMWLETVYKLKIDDTKATHLKNNISCRLRIYSCETSPLNPKPYLTLKLPQPTSIAGSYDQA